MLARQSGGIRYPPKMGIDNPVAAIGVESMAILGLADIHLSWKRYFQQRPSRWLGGRSQAKRDDFDRKREAPEGRNPFRLIRDHNHPVGRRRDDLFAQQGLRRHP